GRTKTVSARQEDGVLVVRAPAGMSDAALQPVIERLQQRIAKRQARRTLDDQDLQRRAEALNAQYFDGAISWQSIRWVTNQDHRWGSCTPATGAIRISHRLATLPDWVLDAVIVHELAHLLEAGHTARFWELANRYPRTERSRGYLMALSAEGEETM
ncbi:MAG TPA: M48 family metallopeptidase, partial [Chloroflexota bacterium]|nr:M48 family metallopeptidase [Chloroflexota bacterium]